MIGLAETFRSPMVVVWFVFLIPLGACVGSFLNVVIYRLPRGLSIVFPGSRCPACGHAIRWYDNVPLLSWMVLRGRCRACGAPISPRYLIVETATAVLVAGLFAWYFLLDLRAGMGPLRQSWPVYASHAALLCCLLVCAIVDIESWCVPLEVCWFVSALGLVVAAAAAPTAAVLPRVSPAAGAAALGAAAGLAVAIVLLRYGIIQQSFLDADDRAAPAEQAQPDKAKALKGKTDKGKTPKAKAGKGKTPKAGKAAKPTAVAISAAHGVRPRIEILREVVFLAPPALLAAAAYLLVTRVAPISRGWLWLTSPQGAGAPAAHVNAFLAALFGYLVGGSWIWGTRLLGTLAFGKEAMGLGDVHILAAVGAVCGWTVPSAAFFVAPVFGLLWALYLWIGRNQRELPYGPWLGAGALTVMLFYDRFAEVLRPYAKTAAMLMR